MPTSLSAVRPLRTPRLRVAIVAPPWFTVPPSGYGGVENVCADLVSGLLARGHDVSLVSVGEPGTAARFVRSYRTPPSERLGEPLPEVLQAAAAARFLAETDVDVVHDHTLAGPLLARGRRAPTVVTMHGPVAGEAGEYYQLLGDTIHLVALSEAQRTAAPQLPWVGTVPNAVDVDSFPFRADKHESVLFLGRMHPDKAPHLAIDAARAAGRSIVLAGKCSEPIESAYFQAEVAPRLGDDATYVGSADAVRKRELLSRATALLFPVQWEEPFGMVMIEAMACGTPVVALRRGAVPEVVVDGVTGIVRTHTHELGEAIELAARLDPHDCRAHVESTFSVQAMVTGYEAVYRSAIARRATIHTAPPRTQVLAFPR